MTCDAGPYSDVPICSVKNKEAFARRGWAVGGPSRVFSLGFDAVLEIGTPSTVIKKNHLLLWSGWATLIPGCLFTASPGNDCDLYAHHSTARILMPLHYSIVFVIGLVGNVLALAVIIQNRKKINSTTLYSTNLVISDILFTTALPTRIAYYALGFDWRIGDALCRVTALVFYINTYAGVNFMTCLSIDRFFAVVHPLRIENSSPMTYHTKSKFLSHTFKPLNLISLYCPTCTFQVCILAPSRCWPGPPELPLLPCAPAYGIYKHTSKLKPKVKEKSIRIIITLMVQVLICFMPFHVCFAFLMLEGDENSYNPWGAFTTFLMNLSTCLDVILYYIVSKQFQARVISVMLYRNYLRSVRRKSFRSGQPLLQPGTRAAQRKGSSPENTRTPSPTLTVQPTCSSPWNT
ncbi:hypothetical protein GH733_006528 [Mirounga leonina]|nr:hypothetical protein GH733_006528 [Mirounga leonina]